MPASAQSIQEKSTSHDYHVRDLDPSSASEVELVAKRMRQTLIEVEGEEIGTSLYSMDWLKERVRWHLDPCKTTAQVFLAERSDGYIVGHTIVRMELDEASHPYGLFSTTFVALEARRHTVATKLLIHGERWMANHGLKVAVTWTSATNLKLVKLFCKHGYTVVGQHTHGVTSTPMVKSAKSLNPHQADSVAPNGC